MSNALMLAAAAKLPRAEVLAILKDNRVTLDDLPTEALRQALVNPDTGRAVAPPVETAPTKSPRKRGPKTARPAKVPAKRTRKAKAEKAPGAVAPASKRTKGHRRSSQEIAMLAGRFVDHVKLHPGQKMEVIAPSLGFTTADLRAIAAKLVEQRRLTAQGTKRAMTYWPVATNGVAATAN